MRNTLLLLPFLLSYACMASAQDGVMDAGEVVCEELMQAASNRATAARAVARQTADMIDSGESLEEQSCFAGFREIGFDPFGSLPSNPFSFALDRMYEDAKDRIVNAACEASEMAMESANELLTCSAAVGVKLDANAGFDDIDVEACAGYGLDMTIDGGSHNIGGSGTTVGGSTGGESYGIGGSAGFEGAEQDRGRSGATQGWESWR